MTRKQFLNWLFRIVAIGFVAMTIGVTNNVVVHASYDPLSGGYDNDGNDGNKDNNNQNDNGDRGGIDGGIGGDVGRGGTATSAGTAGVPGTTNGGTTTYVNTSATGVGSGTTAASARQVALGTSPSSATSVGTARQNALGIAKTTAGVRNSANQVVVNPSVNVAQPQGTVSSIASAPKGETPSRINATNKLQPRASRKKSHHKGFKTTYNGKPLDKYQKREVAYMKKHWKNYNPHYPKFGWITGGDCTNWASQIAVHGGKRMTSKSKHTHFSRLLGNKVATSKKKWYCKILHTHKMNTNSGPIYSRTWTYSTTFTTVNGFWDYWTGVKHKPHFTTHSIKKVASKVKVGDVIQLHAKGKGWFHTVTVSKVTKHMVYYTSHITNRLFMPITKLPTVENANKFRVIGMGI